MLYYGIYYIHKYYGILYSINYVLQVITGKRKKAVTQGSPKKQKVVEKQGFMVMFKDEDGDPNIAKVTELGNTTLTVALHRGDINGQWVRCKSVFGGDVIKTIQKESVLNECTFALTQSQHLPCQFN